jgi:PAS domain S-box-containing protein
MKLSTRLILGTVSLVLITGGATVTTAWFQLKSITLPRAVEHLKVDAQALAADMERTARIARADTLSFGSAVALDGIVRAHLNGGVHPTDGTSEAVWRRRMAERFAAELAFKPFYYQFRFIGVEDGGREIVRVDRSGKDGAIRIVPDAELQRKGDTDYFRQAVELPAGTALISELDLNRERGEVERPHVPVLRVATPIRAADGSVFGIVIVNVDVRPVLDRIRAHQSAETDVYVINQRGDYLLHPFRGREFGFEFGRSYRIQDDFPGLAPPADRSATPRQLLIDGANDQLGVGIAPLQWTHGPWIAVAEIAPYAAIMHASLAVRRATIMASAIAVIVGLILAVWLSCSLSWPLTRMTEAVEAFGRGKPAQPPLDAGGEIGVLARAFAQMVNDIGEKSAAIEKEVIERRRLFETSLDLILITDRAGKFLQVSPSAQAILGYEPAAMIGRSAVEFINAQDLPHTRQHMRQVRRGRTKGTFETRYVHHDGRLVPLAWTGVWSDVAQQHIFIGRDMTEQKLVQDRLTRALSRQQAIFNSAMIGIITLNESGSIEELNPSAEQIFGVTSADVARRDIGRLIDLGGPSDVSSAAQLRHLAADDADVRELEGHRPDKTTFPVNFEIADMPIGERRMFVVFVRDITTRKRHERMKDEFVATVSHELRTPMTSIAGSLGLLAGGAAGPLPDPAKRLLGIAHSNSQRLVRLINDILDIEKIESGQVVFALQPVELKGLVEQAMEANKGFAESFGVTVRLDAASAEAVVRVDPDRMTQVIINLLSNAVKFSPRGEEILVGVENKGTTTRVTVRDRGPGVPEEYRARIFEKFVQVDATDARQKGGTGLGLSIVQQIMVRLGGEVGLEPAPGGGTTFHVELPCWDHIELLETERLGRAGNALILLCEDDPDAAAVLSGRLRAAGFPTDVACTAEEAVKGAASRSYAAILVDLQLPDSDGISLIKNLRAQPRYHNTPIVVVSADPKRGRDDKRSSALNVLDWLEKPVDTERLLHVLNRPIVRDNYVRPRILHLDDDRDVLRVVAQALSSTAEVVSVETIDEARHVLDTHHFDLAVLDVGLAEGFGLDLIPDLCGPDGRPIPVVVFSAQDSPEVAARVLAVLSKSRASIDSLVTTLRRLVAGRVFPSNPVQEVA